MWKNVNYGLKQIKEDKWSSKNTMFFYIDRIRHLNSAIHTPIT